MRDFAARDGHRIPNEFAVVAVTGGRIPSTIYAKEYTFLYGVGNLCPCYIDRAIEKVIIVFKMSRQSETVVYSDVTHLLGRIMTAAPSIVNILLGFKKKMY